jgi:hypothetical protein
MTKRNGKVRKHAGGRGINVKYRHEGKLMMARCKVQQDGGLACTASPVAGKRKKSKAKSSKPVSKKGLKCGPKGCRNNRGQFVKTKK